MCWVFDQRSLNFKKNKINNDFKNRHLSDVISCQGFRKLNECSSLFENLSCSGIKSDISTIMSIQSLVCWSEIRDVLLKSIFEIQASLVKDPTHVIQCSPSIVLYFENKNQPVVRLKWFFPWFFLSTLNSDFGYIFWWSVMRWHFYEFRKQDAQALSRKVVSFLSIYFISMHNNQ